MTLAVPHRPPFAAGDATAHALPYDHHAAALLHCLQRLVADPRVAEELLHDVFLDAWRGAADFRGDGRVLTWLLAIAHSRGCNELRRRAARSPATRKAATARSSGRTAWRWRWRSTSSPTAWM